MSTAAAANILEAVEARRVSATVISPPPVGTAPAPTVHVEKTAPAVNALAATEERRAEREPKAARTGSLLQPKASE